MAQARSWGLYCRLQCNFDYSNFGYSLILILRGGNLMEGQAEDSYDQIQIFQEALSGCCVENGF